MSSPLPTAAVAALCLSALAGTALAQCDVYRSGIPDFDQRRSALPGNGNWFCVPTAALDAVAYIANNGYPNAMSGPRNWQDPANYDFVSQRLAYMGGLMGAGATNGTSGSGAYSGLTSYLNQYVPGQFYLLQKGAYKTYSPSAYEFYQMMAYGGLVNIGMAQWKLDPSTGVRSRVGGHATMLSHIYGACTSLANIGWKDPWTDDQIYDQSAFATTISDFQGMTAKFDNGNGTSSVRTQWQLLVDLPGKEAFVDGYMTIFPIYGLTTGPTYGKMTFYFPIWFTSLDPKPPTMDLKIPDGADVRQCELSPDFNQPWVRVASTRTTPPRIHRFEPNSGELIGMLDLQSDDGPMTFGRHSELFVYDGGVIKKFDSTDGKLTPADVKSPTGPCDGMDYDDSTDQLVVLDDWEARLKRFTRDLEPVSDEPLPIQMADGSVRVSPADHAVWIAPTGGHAIHKLKADPLSGRLTIGETITLNPDQGGVQGLEVSELGHIFYTDGVVIHELEKRLIGDSWSWIPSPDSLFAGRKAGRFFRLPHSRTNWEPGMFGRGDVNVLPDTDHAEVVDCVADFDGNHFVNGDDFDAFSAAFNAGTPAADINHDGFVTGDDFDTFAAAFDGGC